MSNQLSDELVTIETFWNASEAHVAKSCLEEAGVEGFLENEFSVSMTPHLASPAGIKLNVRRSDVQMATDLLKPQE